jgi:hypothetical protein
MRLDEAKVEELRHWGQALRGASSEGSVAAGRAILMLIEELERSRLELRRAREQLEGVDHPVSSALHGRLQQALSQDSDQSLEIRPVSVEESGQRVETDTETTSVHSWIETLRRQK